MNELGRSISYCVGDGVFSSIYYAVRRYVYLAVQSSEPFAVDTILMQHVRDSVREAIMPIYSLDLSDFVNEK